LYAPVTVNPNLYVVYGNGKYREMRLRINQYMLGQSVTCWQWSLEIRQHFVGWNTQANGTGIIYATVLNLPWIFQCYLFAQGRPSPLYVSPYNGNGNSSGPFLLIKIIHYRAIVTVLGIRLLDETGFTFVGWNTQSTARRELRNRRDFYDGSLT